MDTINQPQDGYADLAQRLARTESKLGATNFMLCIMMLCLLGLTGAEGYRMYQQQQQAAILKSASTMIGQQLQAFDSGYKQAVYDDPENRGIMDQMFRVLEFQYTALKLIVFQNQLLLTSQAEDSAILSETFSGYANSTP